MSSNHLLCKNTVTFNNYIIIIFYLTQLQINMWQSCVLTCGIFFLNFKIKKIKKYKKL